MSNDKEKEDKLKEIRENLERDAKEALDSQEDGDIRAYVLFDKDTKSITLYYYVLGEWYSIYETRLQMEGSEDIEIETENLVSLNRVISKDEFQKAYANLGERLFTGSVVDSLLANGDLENRFVRQALVDELNSPDSHMIKMLANKLTDYSTQENEWLEEKLNGLMGTGLISILETAITNEEIEIVVRPKAQPLPSATPKRPKKQNEVATDIGHKADKLKEAGFSTDNLGKGSTDTGKEEEEDNKQEDKYQINNLRDQLTSGVQEEDKEESPKPEPFDEESDTGMKDISDFFDS